MAKRVIGIATAAMVVGGSVLSGCAGRSGTVTAGTAGASSTQGSTEAVEASFVREGGDVLLVIKGMSCPMCASNIDNELAEIPGVKRVAVDLNTGTVRVSLTKGAAPTAAQFERAVYDSGFTLARIERP
ncbi:MAG: heavy-metal-associated domain-containing protein [Planctomycetota bacterium]